MKQSPYHHMRLLSSHIGATINPRCFTNILTNPGGGPPSVVHNPLWLQHDIINQAGVADKNSH